MEADGVAYRCAVLVWVHPRVLVYGYLLCGLVSHGRRERAELEPAQEQFRVVFCGLCQWLGRVPPFQLVTAQIVCPEEADISRCGVVNCLEFKRFPRCEGVSGKADRIPVSAESAVAAKVERTLAACRIVLEKEALAPEVHVNAGVFCRCGVGSVVVPEKVPAEFVHLVYLPGEE